MASLNEAFADLGQELGKFYTEQKVKYQEVEPNRLLPDAMKGPISKDIIDGAMGNLEDYDPYTGKNTSRFSAAALKTILQGQPTTTKQETACRAYQGLSGLNQLIADTANNPYAPVRCGWRYKKSSGSGYVAEVAQGALGTRNGPLNNNAREDALGNGVKWVWNLNDAKKNMLRDVGNNFKTAPSLAIVNNVMGGQLKNQLGWCTTTNRMIPLNEKGNAAFPQVNTLNCPPASIVTDPVNLPPPSATTTGFHNLAAAAEKDLATCVTAGNTNSSLSRDCLLMAVKNNGCSDSGALYQSLQAADPNASSWSSTLLKQPSFQQYQSKQGDNGITENLFNKDKGTWQLAVSAIERLQKATMAADPFVSVSAKDLCTAAGTYEKYNFCNDITDDTRIDSVDMKCVQSYWQNEDGKPAGIAYPRDKNFNKFLLGAYGKSINTWASYKAAVAALKGLTAASDPVIQRKAMQAFYGVQVSTLPFTPKKVGIVDTSEPCNGLGQASPQGDIRSYTKAECDQLDGNYYPRSDLGSDQGECLVKTGGSYSAQCGGLNMKDGPKMVLWLDAKDGSTLTIDGKNGVSRWRDKSGNGRDVIQADGSSRPTYTRTGGQSGLVFNGTSSFLPIPNAYNMVSSSFSIFFVEKRSVANPGWLFGGQDQAYYRNLHIGYRSENQFDVDFWGTAESTGYLPSYSGTEATRIWSITNSITNAITRNIYLNGSLNKSGASSRLSVDLKLQGWNGAAIGRVLTGFYSGTIYEIIFYSAALSDNERQQVEGYLAAKYGLSSNLPSSNPYKAGV